MDVPYVERAIPRGPAGADTYEDVLATDTRNVPEFMHEGSVPNLGLDPIPVSNYLSHDYFAKEVAHVWEKTWQVACREEDISDPGDYHLYENVGKSLIVARLQSGEIKAFHNVCLHRGRKLVNASGCRKEFRCAFHGITWDLGGELKLNPLSWDLPQWKEQDMSLPEVQVATWGGFIFINMDSRAAPLEDFIGPMARDLDRYDLANSYKVLHLVKTVRSNWKVLAEAFMESSHSSVTHPQTKTYIADTNAQYDVLSDYVTRNFVASGVPSPCVADKNYTPSDIVRAMGSRGFAARAGEPSQAPATVPEGVTSRAFLGEAARQARSAEDGFDYSEVSDAELIDSLLYNVWPHMSFWGGYVNIYYSWRPNGLDPDTSIMEVMLLKRVPKGAARPKPARVHSLGLDEPFSAAPNAGPLGAVFDQDLGNVPFIQEGLRASPTGVVHFCQYTEIRLRKLHQLIDHWISVG